MKRVVLLSLVLSLPALASRPTRNVEILRPTTLDESPRIPTAVFLADLGAGAWTSSYAAVPGLAVTIGLGRHVTRHVLLTGELDAALMPDPSRPGSMVALMSLTGHLGWDVLEIFRQYGHYLPLELGPDLGVGVSLSVPPGDLIALPVVYAGAFVRYVFGESLSLGLRLRSQLPIWTEGLPSFSLGNGGLPGALEPYGLMATVSVVTTF